MKREQPTLGVIIPTYNRGAVLLDTIQLLLRQSTRPDEVIVVDQTHYEKGDKVAEELLELNRNSQINWCRRTEPSIPKAMNAGMLKSQCDWVLFIDDDVTFSDDFIAEHVAVIQSSGKLAHIGQIVQPWEQVDQGVTHGSSEHSGFTADLAFSFNSADASNVSNCMAGNLCVHRNSAIKAGGFDENFYGVAYRFETEFCKRFCKVHDTTFYYSPRPILNHLHLKSGGTRAHANHLTSSSPVHSMGDYYFALLHGGRFEKVGYILSRLLRSVVAKFYLQKPWFIPVRVCAEFRGFTSALSAYQAGQALIDDASVE